LLPPANGSLILARYFLHLRDGTDETLDPDGVEYASLDELRRGVMSNVRDLISGDVERGVIDLRFRIDAEDETGAIIYTLPFAHAISIIPETAHSSAA
jgi:hypothetical protein